MQWKKNMCDGYSCIFYTWFQPKLHWKRCLSNKISIFLHWISLNKMGPASNFWTSLHRHNIIDACNVFTTKALAKWSVKAATFSLVSLCKQFRAQFRLCQVKNYVQTACESHDLNMDFCSFDNGFKQLPAINYIQAYVISKFLINTWV